MKKRRNRSNLNSPRSILTACDLTALQDWYLHELDAVPQPAIREVSKLVVRSLNEFVKWPKTATLLWNGATRAIKYHRYPDSIKLLAMQMSIAADSKFRLDNRTNGPAIAAYLLAGGERPARFGSANRWTIHHIYSGKFPFPGKAVTLHAASEGMHCTQSAGLIAAHPIADQMCDEFPAFSWLLRAEAFLRFNYDPDGVFSAETHDEFGFVGNGCKVIPVE